MNDKNVIIIAGLTASGKTTVLEKMVESFNFEKLVTSTTREPRPGEVNGVDYHFLSKKEFKNRIDNGLFIEHVENKGHFYGAGTNSFEKDFKNKQPALILDPMGVVEATKILEKEGWNVMSIFLDVPKETCIRRVLERNADEAEIRNRISDINGVEKNWKNEANYSVTIAPSEGETIESLAKKFKQVANIYFETYEASQKFQDRHNKVSASKPKP